MRFATLFIDKHVFCMTYFTYNRTHVWCTNLLMTLRLVLLQHIVSSRVQSLVFLSNLTLRMDLDDLLDDVDMSQLKSKAVDPKAKVAAAAKEKAKVEEKPKEVAKEVLLSSEIRPWLAASANVPKEFRDKWTKMVKIDTQTEMASKLQPSTSYCEWDPKDPNNQLKRGVSKCLQELVRISATNCGLPEPKAAKIASLVNPITDSERGTQLNKAFTRQVIRDLRFDLVADPNYDPKRFKNLAVALGKEKS